jgi:hypothetical protein
MTPENKATSGQRPSVAAPFIATDTDNISVLADQTTDNLVHVVMALGAELWAVKRRMMTLEKVLEAAGIPADRVETFVPGHDDAQAWQVERDIFIRRVFSGLARTGGANAAQPDMSVGL